MLHILLLEDNPADAQLIVYELQRAQLPFIMRRAITRESFLSEIKEYPPDIILADFTLPQFSAIEALDLLAEKQLDIPCILVTGTQSEEVAVECIMRGADDYILKQSLVRLPSAITNVLRKRDAERNREAAERQLRASYQQLRALSARLQSVREEERKRIAREIHDELGQTLTAIRMDIAWIQSKLAKLTDPEAMALRDQILSTAEFVESAIKTVRRIATELRPRILDEMGLVPALEWQISEFQNRTGIHCTFTTNVQDMTIDPDRSTAMFRILQESLTNVSRHANATSVKVVLRAEGHHASLEISDNGRGITEMEITNLNSLGLLGMRERATLLGGSVRFHARNQGTTVFVEMPV